MRSHVLYRCSRQLTASWNRPQNVNSRTFKLYTPCLQSFSYGREFHATKEQSAADGNYFDAEEFDWDAYLKYRFSYKKRLYQRILMYHFNKGAKHKNIAHDVGTGPGNVASVLGVGFDKVVASDASEFYAAAARRRLSDLVKEKKYPEDKFTVLHCRAEDIADHPETQAIGKADLVTVAECMGFLDPVEAIDSFSKVLRPGGTLAIWFYGRPNFIDGGERMNQLYTEIATKIIQRFEPEAGTTWQFAAERICSWFDVVEFPRDKFKDVQRIKWNSDKPIYFWDDKVLWPGLDWTSAVKEDEQVKYPKWLGFWPDRSVWAMKGDIEWVEGFHKALQPGTEEKITPEIRDLYNQLEQEMGGRGVQHNIVFPAVLMLATKT